MNALGKENNASKNKVEKNRGNGGGMGPFGGEWCEMEQAERNKTAPSLLCVPPEGERRVDDARCAAGVSAVSDPVGGGLAVAVSSVQEERGKERHCR